MRKNYFAKLVKYIKNVYHIENRPNKSTDLRANLRYDKAQVITLVLLVFLLRIKSFNELNLMIKNNEFSKIFPFIQSLYICGNSSSIKDGMEIKKINNFIVRYGSEMEVNMIGRMKRDISTLNNKKIGKEITQYTIATVIIWIYVWIMNIVKDNDVVGKLVLVIMSFIVLCGCITAFKTRKNKMILIFFKVISLWMMSLAFLSMAYTSYYVFLKFKNIYFLYLTIFIYILIFFSTLRIVIIRAKTEMKIKKEIMNKNKTVLIGGPIFFGIGYFIIEPIVKKYGQFTMLVTIIYFCLLICYILVACSTYYLVEYKVSKQLNKK